MSDLATFARRMKQLGKNIETNASTKARLTALAIHRNLTEATPIKVGVAISNWQANLDGPATRTLQAYAPGTAGETREANTKAAQAQAAAATAPKRPGQAIHITNNAPHIVPLNKGKSDQAPAGFVEASVLRGVAETRGIKIVK